LLPLSFAYDCSQLDFSFQDSCEVLNTESEGLIANLIYNENTYPNHSFLEQYNQMIVLSPPTNTTKYFLGSIHSAWLELLTVQPSVKYDDTLFVPQTVTLRSEADYEIVIPPEYVNSVEEDGAVCRLKYSSTGDTLSISWYGDGVFLGEGKLVTASTNASLIEVQSIVRSFVEVKRYEWERYCSYWKNGQCQDYDYDCNYQYSYTYSDELIINDSQQIEQYVSPSPSRFELLHEYDGTHQGELTTHPRTNTLVSTSNAFFKQDTLRFQAEFLHEPYYFLQLVAINENTTSSENVFYHNTTLYLPESSDCEVTTTDFFQITSNSCLQNYTELSLPPFQKEKSSIDMSLLWKGGLFLLIIILLFKVIRKTWGKALLPLGMLFLLPRAVKAESCGLSNLASCIPENLFNFFIEVINAPLVPLLELTKNLLTNPVSIDLFQALWSIIIYILSMFFGLLIIYSGFQFLFSGHNVIRRELAKQWLKNTIIMIVLVQASFYLYKLTIELGSIMSSSIMSLVDPEFFLLTASSLANIGLELLFGMLYALTLLLSILLLGIRYMIVAFGVLFAPIGIFCYFIPPLKTYGRLIINSLLMNIFMTFIASIIILASSMLIDLNVFGNMKILVMINCFSIINIVFIILTIKTIKKSVVGDGAEKMAEAAKYIAMMA
jgi:hypothetical protein